MSESEGSLEVQWMTCEAAAFLLATGYWLLATGY
jgi:hypothetical protein